MIIRLAPRVSVNLLNITSVFQEEDGSLKVFFINRRSVTLPMALDEFHSKIDKFFFFLIDTSFNNDIRNRFSLMEIDDE